LEKVGKGRKGPIGVRNGVRNSKQSMGTSIQEENRQGGGWEEVRDRVKTQNPANVPAQVNRGEKGEFVC